jgi:hypothetical protein
MSQCDEAIASDSCDGSRNRLEHLNLSLASMADLKAGGGMQDIVLIHDGNVEYWLNLGHNRWGKRIHMCNSLRYVDFSYTFGMIHDASWLSLGHGFVAPLLCCNSHTTFCFICCNTSEVSCPISCFSMIPS